METMDGMVFIKECTEVSYIINIILIITVICVILLSALSLKIGKLLFNRTGNDSYFLVGRALSLTVICVGMLIIRRIPSMEQFQIPNGEYEVVLNNDVNMEEFKSKYEIIGFENNVYTINLKDNTKT